MKLLTILSLSPPFTSQSLKQDKECLEALIRPDAPATILHTALVEPIKRTHEGDLVRAASIPWWALVREIRRNPGILTDFAKSPRRFEEFIAAAYKIAGWDDVILTPRSGDRGRDVIVTKHGFGAIRFLDQCKAYSPHRLVTHDDVRAMLGALQTSPNASKAIITTTSDFEPRIRDGDEFKPFLPYRLELRNGAQLVEWLEEVYRDNSAEHRDA